MSGGWLPSSQARFTERGLRPRLPGEPAEWHHALAPYNETVNPTSAALAQPVPASANDLPEGLSVDEAVRIAEAISATHAASTRAVYRCMWGRGNAGAEPGEWCRCRPAGDDLRLPHRTREGGRLGPHARHGLRWDLLQGTAATGSLIRISFMMDVLSGVLTGSGYAAGVVGPYVPDRRSGCGHLVLALKVDTLLPDGSSARGSTTWSP